MERWILWFNVFINFNVFDVELYIGSENGV